MERKGKSKEIMVAFLILIMGLMMAFMVPTWETPDEYTHLWMIGDSIGVDGFADKITDSIGWPYETKGITLDRWYGIPVTLENNVKRLHQEAFNETDYTPSDTVKDISNQIIEKTGYSK